MARTFLPRSPHDTAAAAAVCTHCTHTARFSHHVTHEQLPLVCHASMIVLAFQISGQSWVWKSCHHYLVECLGLARPLPTIYTRLIDDWWVCTKTMQNALIHHSCFIVIQVVLLARFHWKHYPCLCLSHVFPKTHEICDHILPSFKMRNRASVFKTQVQEDLGCVNS